MFVYGFPKSQRGNIDQGELRAFKAAATHIFGLRDEQVLALMAKGQMVEIRDDDQVPE